MDLKFRAKWDFQICSGKKNPELFWKYASEIQDKKGLPELFWKKIQNFSGKMHLKFRTKKDFQKYSGKKNPELIWKHSSDSCQFISDNGLEWSRLVQNAISV